MRFHCKFKVILKNDLNYMDVRGTGNWAVFYSSLKVAFVTSTSMAGQPEVNRNEADHLVRLLPLAGQPATSHLPLHTPDRLLHSQARGRKPAFPKHVSAQHTTLCHHY